MRSVDFKIRMFLKFIIKLDSAMVVLMKKRIYFYCVLIVMFFLIKTRKRSEVVITQRF